MNPQNLTLIQTYFQHFNNHDWQKMAEMYVEIPQMKDPAYGQEVVEMSQADIVAKYSELHEMFPDIQDHVTATYPSGDNVIVEFISAGTAPDGMPFELHICTIFEIKDGKITKDFTYYDNFGEE
jgi:ketosteroid isomerase-like protein